MLAFTYLPGALELDLKNDPQLVKDFLANLNGMAAALLLEDAARPDAAVR